MDWTAMDWLYAATTVFLVGFFVVAEIVRSRRAVRGRFRAFLPDESPAAAMLYRKALVDLPDGESVCAVLGGCVLCQGDYRAGDPVQLNHIGGRYEVAIPLAGKACAPRGGR